jgi:hypothetical protein
MAYLHSFLNVNAQKISDKDVPEAVKIKFTSIYPEVKSVKWEMKTESMKQNLKTTAQKTSVLFEANGTYILTETEIAVTSLPQTAKDYAAKNVPGKKYHRSLHDHKRRRYCEL